MVSKTRLDFWQEFIFLEVERVAKKRAKQSDRDAQLDALKKKDPALYLAMVGLPFSPYFSVAPVGP